MQEIDRQLATERIAALGATLVHNAVGGFTHLILAGKPDASTTEVKMAKQSGRVMVHPIWLERCQADNARVNEGDFPPTYDRRKSSQLDGLVESTPRDPNAFRLEDRTMIAPDTASPGSVQSGRQAQVLTPSTMPPPTRPSGRRYDNTLGQSSINPDNLRSSALASGRPYASTALQPPESIEHPSREWNDLGGEDSFVPHGQDDSSPASRRMATQSLASGSSLAPGTVERQAIKKHQSEVQLARQTEDLLAQLQASEGNEPARTKGVRKRVSLIWSRRCFRLVADY